MCFSANASFGAGIVLTVIGVSSIRSAQQPKHILFASIPLLFAIQQIAEGFLWLTLPFSEYYFTQQVLTYLFLFFAQFFWPLWSPFAIYLFEKEIRYEAIYKILIGIGLIVSLYSAFSLSSYPVHAKIIGYHISYTIDNPYQITRYGGILYFIATIVPPFLSRIKGMWMFGATILASYIISAIFYEHYIVSVWCFFASIISLSIFIIVLKSSKYKEIPAV